MFKKLKNFIVAGVIGLTMTAPALVPAALASAATNNVTSGLCTGTDIATNTGGTITNNCTNQQATGSIKQVATNVVNIFSVVVGVIAVIMIIYGGFKYITSGGDSGNVSAAKNTLIYAVIGLIIVALSQFIVHVVLTTSSEIAP